MSLLHKIKSATIFLKPVCLLLESVVQSQWRARSGSRAAWTKEEKAALFRFFRKQMHEKRAPSKQECIAFIEKYKDVVHASRDWQKIQYYVKYITQKAKKIERNL